MCHASLVCSWCGLKMEGSDGWREAIVSGDLRFVSSRVEL